MATPCGGWRNSAWTSSPPTAPTWPWPSSRAHDGPEVRGALGVAVARPLLMVISLASGSVSAAVSVAGRRLGAMVCVAGRRLGAMVCVAVAVGRHGPSVGLVSTGGILPVGVGAIGGALLAGVWAASGVLLAGAMDPGRALAGPLVAAHRGGSLLWTENTLRAFRGALTLPVDFVETDLHRTADGDIVLIHDPTIERMTTGRGAVRDLSREALAAVRIRGADGVVTAEGIPRLVELLDLAAPTSVRLLLEIKVGADGSRYPGIEEATLDLVRPRGLLPRVVIMSFDRATIRRVRELDGAVRTSLLVGRSQLRGGGVDAAGTLGWAREVGATDLGLDHRLIDRQVVEAARRTGLRLAAWTVNEEADIRRMIDLGVDVIISDRPDLAARLAGR